MRGPVSTVTEALQFTNREHTLPRRSITLPPHETELRNWKRKFTANSALFVRFRCHVMEIYSRVTS